MEFHVETHRFEMLDTGIGQSLGFESDKAFRAHQEAERAKLPPEVQEAIRDHQRAFTRALLWGDQPPATLPVIYLTPEQVRQRAGLPEPPA